MKNRKHPRSQSNRRLQRNELISAIKEYEAIIDEVYNSFYEEYWVSTDYLAVFPIQIEV